MQLDLKVAARALRARPLFTLVAVATLAVGIGSNAAIFSVVNAVLLRPLPFPRSDHLVALYSRYLPAAFFLAGLGLYGILAYRVEQRAREIGVRMALGADSREIFHLVIGGGFGLAALGVLIGVPAALVLTRLLRGFLSGVTTTDPWTYGAVIAVLTLAALVASYLPAQRATRVDPIAALRGE